MSEIINAKQLRARLKEVVSKVRDGERFYGPVPQPACF